MMFDAIVTWENCFTLFSHTCEVTGERIPGFSMVWRKCESYYVRDMVNDQYTWYSDAGYMLEKLKDNA